MNRLNRLLGALIVLLLALSLLRTCGAEPPASGPPERSTPPAATADESVPATGPTPAASQLRIDVQAEVAWNATGPPLELRLRARDGAERPFDVTAREAQTRQKLALTVALPVARPELPLRGELLGDTWCIPPGTREFQVVRLDPAHRLVLVRARSLDVTVVADGSGTPIAGAELVHESGVALATTGPDGRARLLRPRNRAARREELLLARASGFLPALLDEPSDAAPSATLALRATTQAGVVRGRVVDAAGAAVAGALVAPRYAGLAAARELPALAVTSDAAGRFELPVPWPGRLDVTARTRELGRVSATLAEVGIAEAGRVTELELRFPPQFELRVEALRDGRPLARVACELVQREGAQAVAIAVASTGVEGRITLRAPAVAPLWIVARAEGLAPAVRELVADPDRGSDVVVALAPGRSVTLTVTGAESLPLPQRIVAWRDAASQLLLGEAPIGADGRVTLAHVPEGRRLELFMATGGAEETLLRELELAAAEGGAAATTPLDLGALALPGG